MIRIGLILVVVARVAAADPTYGPQPAPIGPQPVPSEDQPPPPPPTPANTGPVQSIDAPLPKLVLDDRRPIETGGPITWSPHVSTGFELVGASGVTGTVWRSYLGASVAFGTGPVRPMLGAGMTLGWGQLSVDDPRALDGSVSIAYLDYGPELQLGARFGNARMIETRVFGSFALLRTELDRRLMFDSVGGVAGATGTRAGLGVNWAGRIPRAKPGDGWILLLLPQQIEVNRIDSAGSTRWGVTFAYGI